MSTNPNQTNQDEVPVEETDAAAPPNKGPGGNDPNPNPPPSN